MVSVNAAELGLHEFNLALLRLLLSRKRATPDERRRMRARLFAYGGKKLVYVGGKVYGMLKTALDDAMDDPDFVNLVSRRALWMEFGVLTGLSTNLTADYLGMMSAAPKDVRVHGFDTFTGLPEPWTDGKGGLRFGKGTFSWAARGRGPTPPVRERVALHVGLFNNTLSPFLDSADGRQLPLAWANIDCDLYAGAREALLNLSPRVCPGTRIHFHELIHERFMTAKRLESGTRSDLEQLVSTVLLPNLVWRSGRVEATVRNKKKKKRTKR